MNVTLDSDLATLIWEKVDAGPYAAAAVLREALALLDQRDRHDRLRAAIDVGLDQIARDQTTSWTPDMLRHIREEALENERRGLPIKTAVMPDP